MSSQDFLLINIGAAVIFVVWYLSARKKSTRQPIKLNLHAKDSGPVRLPAEQNINEFNAHLQTQQNLKVPLDLKNANQRRDQAERNKEMKTKNLNIFFNYNGHMWDAYEVLGVPGGSSLEKVTEAYQHALKSTNQESHQFLETAYKAILNKL